MQLSGSLARGVRLIDQFLPDEPTPQKMLTFEQARSALWRDVGRRSMTWVLHHLEPATDHEAPSRVECAGRLYRRRRRHPHVVATLFGPVTLWGRLYEPLARGGSAMHPLELRVGMEAGVSPPARAERVDYWATEHTQDQGLERLEKASGVQWSCPSLRKLLGSLRTGMAPHRHDSQGDQGVSGVEQARVSTGRLRPTLSVGRDGICVPLRHGVAQEGATATLSVLDRRGTRVGTGYLGQMPASGQKTLTVQLHTLRKDILRRVDSQGRRVVYVTDEGQHPSDYSHSVLKSRTDPRRPWRRLEWSRIVDVSHAGQYMQKVAKTIVGVGAEAQRWAKPRRQVLQTKAAGVARVLQSASALRRPRGLCGPAEMYPQAYSSIKKRPQWMRYQVYKGQHFPLGSGLTEAAGKSVFTQRLQRSGMAWTIKGGQVILDLRVLGLRRVWEAVHQRYLASKPMPINQEVMGKYTQYRQQAA